MANPASASKSPPTSSFKAKLGFIGYGSMARMLIEAFLAAKVCAPSQIAVSTRTREKLAPLAAAHPHLIAAEDNRQTALLASHLFLCVKPLELKGVLEGIHGAIRKDAHIISIAACASLEYLNRLAPGKYTRAIPSLASAGGHGVTLVCHGPGVSAEAASVVESWFATLGPVQRLAEKDFEAGSDLTSCAPGLIAAIFRQFAEAGVRFSDIPQADAERMVIDTLLGTARLLAEGKLGFEELIARVATKGGITEEGVRCLDAGLPPIFDEVFAATLGKHEMLKRVLES
ncbi:MAG: pyrroline-5-carboxylate reductase dimerization domain-containing protein [Fibrobacteria bacterium]